MPRRSTRLTGVGKGIENDRRRRLQQQEQAHSSTRATGVAERHAARSVLEQNHLETFLADAELARANFESVRGERYRPDSGPRIVSGPSSMAGRPSTAEAEAAARRVQVPIPRRPQWQEGTTAEELMRLEGEAFLSWRRSLAHLEEEEGFIMTPYERNLDFWRQLWRCIERSDILVQILDARDPEFYRCRDLESYVATFAQKRQILLVNKADFLSPELRRRWAEHFEQSGVEVVFFSALRELHQQQRLPAAPSGDAEDSAPPHGSFHIDGTDVADCAQLLKEIRSRMPSTSSGAAEGQAASRGVVGFVGYPNVGKSSVINALFGVKKVSMSRTPGKTKHLQTLELPELELTLCDCPGLVFPSVVATKAHLVINGTVPITELRDSVAPVRVVVEKLGLPAVLEKYGLTKEGLREGAARRGEEGAEDAARALLDALAVSRQHVLRLGVPDESWAARKVLHDFVTGRLLHCELPPTPLPASAPKAAAAKAAAAAGIAEAAAAVPQAPAAQASSAAPAPATPAAPDADEATEGVAEGGSDFSDLDEFLEDRRRNAAPKGLSSAVSGKRKSRPTKQLLS